MEELEFSKGEVQATGRDVLIRRQTGDAFRLVCKGKHLSTQEWNHRTSLTVQWLRLCAPIAGGRDSMPGQGTRFHIPQLKILHATTKTQNNQMNK